MIRLLILFMGCGFFSLPVLADEADFLRQIVPPDAVEFQHRAAVQEIKEAERICHDSAKAIPGLNCGEAMRRITVVCKKEIQELSVSKLDQMDRRSFRDTYSNCIDNKYAELASRTK